MNYSLINVTERNGNRIGGYWIQDVCGQSLKKAQQRAEKTRKANGNKIEVAIVSQLNTTTPTLNYHQYVLEMTNA